MMRLPSGLCWLGIALLVVGCENKRLPLTQEAYIWQRVWTPAVEEAIEKTRPNFASYIVLAGEIGWTADGPTFAKAQVDFAALRRTQAKVGIALRIGPYRGPFLANDAVAAFVRAKVQSLLQEWQAAGIMPTELQIDFDCAQSKLAGYQVWLAMIQAAAGKTPVAITVLPSWLGEPAFANLARQAGGYILQVHSVQMPVAEGQSPKIFDETLARRWMQQAEAVGVPFRVALPTYTSQIITNAQGKILRIASEDAPPLLPTNVTSQIVRADAREIAALLAEKSPTHLRGWIWYRLPLATDRMNWRWETLHAVFEQRPLSANFIAHLEGTDISLENTGNIDAVFPGELSADWSGASLLAVDALPGWALERTANRITFHPTKDKLTERLPPGGKAAIGWLRLKTETKIQLQINY